MNPLSSMTREQRDKYLEGERYLWKRLPGGDEWRLLIRHDGDRVLAYVDMTKSRDGDKYGIILTDEDGKLIKFTNWSSMIKYIENRYGIWTE